MANENRSLTFKCSMMMASYYVLMYIVYTLSASYLMEFGYSEATAAALTTVSGLVGLLAKPLYTPAVDGGKCRLLSTVFVAAIAAGNLLLFFVPRKSLALAVVYTVLSGGIGAGFMDLTDSWTLKLIKQNGGLDYGYVRAFGSISYALTAVIFGAAATRFGYRIAPWTIAVMLGVLEAVCLSMPDPEKEEKGSVARSAGIYRDLLKNRRYLTFVILSAVTSGAFTMSDTYAPVLMAQRGGTAFHVGLFAFLTAMIEFFMLRRYTGIADRIGNDKAFAIGMAGFGLKCFALAFMPTPGLLLLSSVTQFVSFCFYIPGRMRFYEEEMDSRSLATALTFSGIFSSLFSTLISGPVAAGLVERMGSAGMLVVYGTATLAAAVLFLLLVPAGGRKENG